MLRGVGLLALAIVLGTWAFGFFRADTVVRPDTVDYAAVAEQAQPGAPFDLAVPSALPDGWRATSATYDPVDQRWHLGILTDHDEYAGVEQAAGDGRLLVADVAAGSTTAGLVRVNGRPWQRLVDTEDGEVTLVGEIGGAGTVVTGSVPDPSLVALVESLEG